MDLEFIGLDVHASTSTICILDARGNRVKTQTIRGPIDRTIDVLRQRARTKALVVCFEASLTYGTVHDRLSQFCRRVEVAHPGRLRLIFKSKRKNDRVDAQKLAKLIFLDEVPTVHVPDLDVRGWRQLIETRHSAVAKRVRTKNALRAILRSLAIKAPFNLWTKQGRAWLSEVALPDAQAFKRDLLMHELAHFDQQVRLLEDRLDALVKSHPGCQLLLTIPGVGPRTAETMVAYIDDPHRFRKTRRIGAYFGLVPCQDASAGVNRLGHITKEGPASARKYLIEAAWQIVRRDDHYRQTYERIIAGKDDRKRIAIVAIAHKLARTILAMLKSGETYRSPGPQVKTQEQTMTKNAA